ncbi:hypothetical protein, partial [Ureibacillus thermosphaericus]|uniref:hypothetical protein n=1 Tax=Ureibacillus thermosphaericus TaxID=51173 RepID=UPI0030C98925
MLPTFTIIVNFLIIIAILQKIIVKLAHLIANPIKTIADGRDNSQNPSHYSQLSKDNSQSRIHHCQGNKY